MKRRVDLTGKQYGDLVVLGKADTNKKGRYWECECSCGKKVTVKQSDLKNRVITSCGHVEEAAAPVVTKAAPAKKKVVAAETAAPAAAPKKKAPAKKASNGTGHVGVTQVELKSGTRFKANISVDGKNKHLGTFDTLEEAVAARKEAEELYRK